MLLTEPHVVERLIYNSGGRHGKHSCEEDAVHLTPPERLSHGKAKKHHAEYYCDGGNDGSSPHFQYLLEREVETEREKKEDNTDVSPRLNVSLIYHRHGVGHVRTYYESSYNIAQHQRLLQLLENQCHNTCDNKNQRKVFYQRMEF